MPHLLVFGLGYTASRLADRLRSAGWQVSGIGRATPVAEIHAAITVATHILSSVPPTDAGDPVLARHAQTLATAPARWLGYLSSTGVYGDAGGAWVDETAPTGNARREPRVAADAAWQALPNARIFRLPGIYGPGRSTLERVRAGTAHRVDAPSQVFSRIHVDDIGSAVIASFERGAPGIYNLADDLPASGNAVTEYACDLLGLPYPAVIPIASLSGQAQGFYAANRRVAATKMTRDLGVRLRYPDYRSGLRACLAENAT